MGRIELHSRPIAITGASSGIGRATAVACARAGMPVALFARRADKLEDARKTIESAGGRAIVVAGDVTSADDRRRLIEETIAAFGSVYAVFANAGYGYEAPVFDENATGRARELFEVNFWASIDTLEAALAHMTGRGEGHLLLCSSCLSKIGLPGYAAYSASKACQDHFGRALRHELRDRGIAVSTVHPVGTRTEFFDRARERSEGRTLFDRTPSAFLQPPEKVAAAIVRRLRTGRGAEVWTGRLKPVPFGLATIMPRLADAVIARRLARRSAG